MVSPQAQAETRGGEPERGRDGGGAVGTVRKGPLLQEKPRGSAHWPHQMLPPVCRPPSTLMPGCYEAVCVWGGTPTPVLASPSPDTPDPQTQEGA